MPTEKTSRPIGAEELTRAIWNGRREEIGRLLRERGFKTQKAIDLATHNFIETMAFVAGETGEPQL